ncbi:HEPN domain-containing protein [Candidatus Bathyarchaeota archaeon]|nr:HEPN domain-containing protein [Candidatus Bathyarchaeota archaeon]
MSQFRRFVEEGKLTRIGIDRRLALKEVEGAVSDLEEAKDSLLRKKFKWATVQGYYSMFHSARALVYSKGFREKSHYALFVALRELFRNQLEFEIIQNFEEAMSLREEADYGLVFSEEGATSIVDNAKKFLNKVKEILHI